MAYVHEIRNLGTKVSIHHSRVETRPSGFMIERSLGMTLLSGQSVVDSDEPSRIIIPTANDVLRFSHSINPDAEIVAEDLDEFTRLGATHIFEQARSLGRGTMVAFKLNPELTEDQISVEEQDALDTMVRDARVNIAIVLGDDEGTGFYL